jgi:hypoxanthine phosphoribosyltransferase
VNLRDVGELHAAIAACAERLCGFDLVVGLPRSGMVPATLIATMHRTPLADLHTYLRGHQWGLHGTLEPLPPSPLRVLLVDDTVRVGSTMNNAAAQIRRTDHITRFAVWESDKTTKHHDFAAGRILDPRVFPWNLWRNRTLARAAIDLDGVLCRDPTTAENDRGAQYASFVSTVAPLYRPQYPVLAIVTGRREEYRQATVDWLRRHGIRYQGLYMKFEAEKHAQSKARHLRALRPGYYVESDPRQAPTIAALSGVPVFCVGDQRVYRP